MPYPKNRTLAVTAAHLPVLKDALSVILEDAKSTHRLEIFSRICGYRTWAALKASLDQAVDRPLLLPLGMFQPDSFILEQPQSVRRRMAALGLFGFLPAVEAGMDLAWDADFGYLGLADDVAIDTILRRREEISDHHLTTPFSIDASAQRALLLSPANRLAIVNGARGIRGLDPIADPGFGWAGAVITPDTQSRFYLDIQDQDIIEASAYEPHELTGSLCHPSRVFSRPDLEALKAAGISHHGRMAFVFSDILKSHTLALEGPDTDRNSSATGNIFDLGYYGCASLDVPEDPDDIDAAFCLRWLYEISNMVQGYLFELDSMTGGRSLENLLERVGTEI